MNSQTKTSKENHRFANSRGTFPPYEIKDYSRLYGIKGFSDRLLKDHFKLYEGYVKNTNEMLEKLAHVRERESSSIEMNELRRRLGWEFNGMRLHEYYFDSLGGTEPLEANNSLASLIESNFGSQSLWKKDFVFAGSMRGIGWVILFQDVDTGKLFNMWIEEHQGNHLVGAQPLLVMDVFEHAFITDYGTDKGKYIDAFLNNINWDEVSHRQRITLIST